MPKLKKCDILGDFQTLCTGGITVIDPFSRGFSLLFSCQKILMKCMQLPLFAIFALTKHPNMNCLKISHTGQFIVQSENLNFFVWLLINILTKQLLFLHSSILNDFLMPIVKDVFLVSKSFNLCLVN